MINFLKKILKIKKMFRSSLKINYKFDDFFNKLKKYFEFSEREFFYKKARHSINCLYCHAVPGTFESGIFLIKKLINEIGLDANCKILNLGGGAGQCSRVLKFMGLDVYNVDINLNEKEITDKNINFDLNKSEDLPFPDNFFDIIYCQEVIEHLESPWNLFRKANKVLKNGGFFLLTTPNICSIHSKKMFTKNNYFHWFTPDCFSYHINPLPYWEIKLIAEKTGFKLLTINGSGDYFFKNNIFDRPLKEIIKDNECLIFLFKKNKF